MRVQWGCVRGVRLSSSLQRATPARRGLCLPAGVGAPPLLFSTTPRTRRGAPRPPRARLRPGVPSRPPTAQWHTVGAALLHLECPPTRRGARGMPAALARIPSPPGWPLAGASASSHPSVNGTSAAGIGGADSEEPARPSVPRRGALRGPPSLVSGLSQEPGASVRSRTRRLLQEEAGVHSVVPESWCWGDFGVQNGPFGVGGGGEGGPRGSWVALLKSPTLKSSPKPCDTLRYPYPPLQDSSAF